MNSCRNALVWAAAIVGVAIAGTNGVIDEDSATTLLIVLPIAGWMTVSGRNRCAIGRSA